MQNNFEEATDRDSDPLCEVKTGTPTALIPRNNEQVPNENTSAAQSTFQPDKEVLSTGTMLSWLLPLQGSTAKASGDVQSILDETEAEEEDYRDARTDLFEVNTEVTAQNNVESPNVVADEGSQVTENAARGHPVEPTGARRGRVKKRGGRGRGLNHASRGRKRNTLA